MRYTLLCILTFVSVYASAATKYVSLLGGNREPYDDWNSAACTIQDAVNTATAGDTIIVSNGVYNSGGLAGARVYIANRLILRSLNGPSSTHIVGLGMMCVYITNGCIEGFTISNGYAFNGGGLYMQPNGIASNCVVVGNCAQYSGGGVAGGTMIDSAVCANRVTSYENNSQGGGTYNTKLINCLITDNVSDYDGGGCAGPLGVSFISNCIIRANRCMRYGGGIFQCKIYNSTITENTSLCGGGSYASRIYNCLVATNISESGGGNAYDYIYDSQINNNVSREYGGCNRCTVYNSEIMENQALTSGGGLYYSACYNSAIVGNSSWNGGGAYYSCELYMCTVSGNTAKREAGGVFMSDLYNCTISDNKAYIGGGASLSSLSRAENCIIWGNKAAYSNEWYGGVKANTYSNFPELIDICHISPASWYIGRGGNLSSGKDIDGQTYRNPSSVGCDEVYNDFTGTLCVTILCDYGSAITGTPVSLAGYVKGQTYGTKWTIANNEATGNCAYLTYVWDTTGEYCVVFTSYNDDNPSGVSATTIIAVVTLDKATYYADADNMSSSWPYSSWATAASNLQDAVDAAESSQIFHARVLVTNGLYALGGRTYPSGALIMNRLLIIRDIEVISVGSLNESIIIGDADSVSIHDAIRCVFMLKGTISGFTISNGNTTTAWDTFGYGAGILMGCDAIASNCIILNNKAHNGGGTFGGTVYNSLVMGNRAEYGGGAMYTECYNCRIICNTSTIWGGGITYSEMCYNCIIGYNRSLQGGGTLNVDCYNCYIIGNEAVLGGGMWAGNANNSVICDNVAEYRGGGSYAGTMQNCTITGNRATLGGGVSKGMLNNSIVWNNSAYASNNYDGNNMENCYTTPMPGSGINYTNNPCLLDIAHLSPWSPCIGKGDSHSVGYDIDGQTWKSASSIGCDEVYSDALTGRLEVSVLAEYTSAVARAVLKFTANIIGLYDSNIWMCDKEVVSYNSINIDHVWSSAGTYCVILIAYNNDNAAGVVATAIVHVVDINDATYYADVNNITPVYPFSTWTTAANVLQNAIDAAETSGILNARVLVTNGVYTIGERSIDDAQTGLRNRVVVKKRIEVSSVNGPAVTVIVGAADPNTGGNGYGATRAVYLRDGYLSGFQIMSGHTRTNTNWSTYDIELNNWLSNPMDYIGGGAAIMGNATVSNCVFTGNDAVLGGGVCFGLIKNCTLTLNRARYGGGVCYGKIYNSIVKSNYASNSPAAYLSQLYNCIVISNTSWDRACAYNCSLFNSTVAYNTHGLFYCFTYNSIVYGNRSSKDVDQGLTQYSCTSNLIAGIGNITNSPFFIDAIHGNYRMSSRSPCINAGTNVYAKTSTDFDGNPRIHSGQVDMGAFEYSGGYVDITNVTTYLSYENSQYMVAGTNSAFIIGLMRVINGATGQEISFPAVMSWITPSISLNIGNNEISVYGTNIEGAVTWDSIILVRGNIGTGAPYVDITNSLASVGYDVAIYTLGITNNIHVVGTRRWTNALTNARGVLVNNQATISLGLGANVITVTGTNEWGISANDTITITHGGIGSGTPFVDITNGTPPMLNYDVIIYTLGITNNMHVVGTRRWTNALTGATGALAGNIATVMLGVGANLITVTCTNEWNISASDTITITRAGFGTGTPFVDITNATPPSLSYDVTSFTLGITNNAHVVGTRRWINSLTSQSGVLVNNLGTIPITVGANLITVTGTNEWNVSASDSITVTCGGIGTGAPYVDITNAIPPILSYDVTSFTLGITNNAHVVGTRRWTNTLTSASGALVNNQATILLGVGANLITVTSTNEWNISASDNLSVTRAGVGTGAPYVDITNTTVLVGNDVTTFAAVGTNNTHVVGTMWVTNETVGGARQTLTASTSWAAPSMALAVGANTILVYGTNAWNIMTNGTMILTRGDIGTGTPFVDITNATLPTLSYDVTRFTLGITNNEHVVGTRRWTNALTRGSDVLVNNQISIPLGVGANLVTVTGTNEWNVSASDIITVMRGPAGTGTPFVDITNAPSVVTYDATSYLLSGTNNINVVGGMTISNTANGQSHSFAATLAWTSPGVPIIVGTNDLVIMGTNAFGDTAADQVRVTRGPAGTGVPYVKIFTTNTWLPYAETSCVLHGTNNANIVGAMAWRKNNGMTNWFSRDGETWSVLLTDVIEGSNIIGVFGTNINGESASDYSGITRQTYQEAVPQISSNALVFPCAGTEICAGDITNISWYIERITDFEDGTNLNITAVSVHISNGLALVWWVTNNVANTAGQITWWVPEKLTSNQADYVVRFEVVDSSSLTNSRLFFNNSFTVVPELSTCAVLVLLGIGLVVRRSIKQHGTA